MRTQDRLKSEHRGGYADRSLYANALHMFGFLIAVFVGVAGTLLFPSLSKHPVFAKGDFLFPEAVGIVFVCLAVFTAVLALIVKVTSNMRLGHRWALMVFALMGWGIAVSVLLFAVGSVWIRYEVRRECRSAVRSYGGDCTRALIRTLTDTKNSPRTRNSAIWALGQLGDSRAQPALKGLYTGIIPDREPLDETLSQYEIRKALRLTGGGLNVPALFWRYGIDR